MPARARLSAAATAVGRCGFALVTLAWVSPLLLGLSLSFRSNNSINSSSLGWPDFGYWSNYTTAWSTGSMPRTLLTSAVIVVVAWVWLVLAGMSASFYFSRRRGTLSKVLYSLVIVGAMVPAVERIFPLYRLLASLGLVGNPVSVVLFQAGSLTPLSCLLYRSFLRRIPRDYEEAAGIDGATKWQALRHVVLPQLRPCTGAVMAITGILMWNDFFTPLLLLSGSNDQTVPIKIYSFVGQYTEQWGDIFALLVMGSVPVIVFFLLMQRYLIAGLGSGVTG